MVSLCIWMSVWKITYGSFSHRKTVGRADGPPGVWAGSTVPCFIGKWIVLFCNYSIIYFLVFQSLAAKDLTTWKSRRPVISTGIVNSLIETSSIDPFGMALDIRLGMLHGSVGIGVTNKTAGINYFTYDYQNGIM